MKKKSCVTLETIDNKSRMDDSLFLNADSNDLVSRLRNDNLFKIQKKQDIDLLSTQPFQTDQWINQIQPIQCKQTINIPNLKKDNQVSVAEKHRSSKYWIPKKKTKKHRELPIINKTCKDYCVQNQLKAFSLWKEPNIRDKTFHYSIKKEQNSDKDTFESSIQKLKKNYFNLTYFKENLNSKHFQINKQNHKSFVSDWKSKENDCNWFLGAVQKKKMVNFSTQQQKDASYVPPFFLRRIFF